MTHHELIDLIGLTDERLRTALAGDVVPHHQSWDEDAFGLFPAPLAIDVGEKAMRVRSRIRRDLHSACMPIEVGIITDSRERP